MLRIKNLLIVLIVLVCSFVLCIGSVYFNNVTEVDETPFEYKIVIYDGLWNNTTYFTNKPPMLSGNSIMFFDALTGLAVVEIAPRITIKQQSGKGLDLK